MMAAPMSTKRKKLRVIVAGGFALLLIVALCSWAVEEIEIEIDIK